MRYCRFQHDSKVRYGLIESVGGQDAIVAAFDAPPYSGEIWPKRIENLKVNEAVLLAPVQPSKIICVGRNYRAHAAELGNEVPEEPLIFFKPPSSLLDPEGTIVRPRISTRVDYEGELGVIIGKTCRKVGPEEDVRPYILGYTCVNDVTARDLQKKDKQWTRGKGFDTFCPVGPIVSDELDPWAGVRVETQVNGQGRQHGTTADFIFPLDEIIRYVSQVMTLMPGDLIATGTPEGVGPLEAGDTVEVRVEGVGKLRNPVSNE
jgi:2-keto-4-pentenoate hydratase/2-oxohepta-3-ene-1,7-dioic acid hydratase in catechol pathway